MRIPSEGKTMSSRHSQGPYSSDDDFFDSGIKPARTETSVISRNHDSSSHDDYSEDDDFDNRSKGRTPTPRRSPTEQSISSDSKSTRSTLTPLSRSRQSSSMRSFTELHSSVKKNYSGNIRKKTAGSKVSWMNPKYGETRPKRSPVVQLMLSSKQQEINDLLNKLSDTKQDLATAEKENKLLKKLQTRHDKAIRKFENTRKELPEYLSANSGDQRTLKLQLRKSQETKRSLESRLNQNFEEMKKMEGVLTRLKKLVYDKSLGERSELSKQLADTESDLEKAQQKIENLDKKIESKLSSYTKQLNFERQKHQKTLKKLQKLEIDYIETNSTLKERERALQKGNIYAFRNKEAPVIEKAILPLTSSTPKLPLPAIPRSQSPKKATLKLENESFRSGHTEVEATPVSSKPKPTTKVFLTADFDTPMTSPSGSFIGGSDSTTKQPESTKEDEENQFARDLRKTEEEIKQLQVSVEQKANLIAKLQEIDRTTPRNPEILKSNEFGEDMFDHKSSRQSQYGISGLSKPPRNSPPSNIPSRMQKDRHDTFGGYNSSIQDSSQRTRPPLKRSSAPIAHDESDADEPLFDLSSGKSNKKPDLLTQLFGKNGGK